MRTFHPLTSVFRRRFAAIATALVALAVSATARAHEWQNSGIWDSDSVDRAFASGPAWFTAGPSWMMNAMPGSNFRARYIDRAGDLQESTVQYNGYVGTLANPFDVSLFSNISTLGGASVSKTSTPTVAAAGGSATWSATPSNANWVPLAGETNWGATAGNFPGATSGLTNADVATFTGTSTQLSIVINSTTLNVKSLTFSGSGISSYTIGSTGGNSLLLTSAGSISIAGGTTGGNNIESVNAPLVLEPPTGGSAGTYSFSNAAAGGLVLKIGGTVTGGTTTSINGITLTLSGGNTGLNEVSGGISDGGATHGLSLVKSGNGTWTLSGGNSYTGGTTISAGTLTATGTSGLGATTGTLALNNANTGAGTAVVLNLSTTAPTTTGSLSGTISQTGVTSGTNTGTINNGGQLFTVNQKADGTYNGVIAGAGGFTLGSLSTNTLTLSGNNTYTGGTTISAGILRAGSTTAIGQAANATLTFSNNSTGKFQLFGFDTTIVSLFTAGGTGAVIENGSTTTNATLTDNTSGSDAFAGILQNGAAGTLALTKSGNGILLLQNVNTYTGNTTINAGELEFLKGTPGIGGSSNSSTFLLGSASSGATLSMGDATGGNTLTSLLTVQAGTGTRILASYATSNSNTYGGNITLNADLTMRSATGGTLLISGTSKTVDLGNHVLTIDDNGGNLSTQGNVTIADQITGSGGSIVKSGPGTLLLQNTGNSYSGGTSIGGGTVGIYNDLSLGAVPGSESNNIFFTGNATLQDTLNNVTLAQNRDINIASGKTATFDSNGHTFTINGSMNGDGNIAKTGSGMLTLTGPNFVTGTATINTNGGTLNAAANSALGSGSAGTAIGPSSITVNSGGTLMLSNSSATDRVRSDAPITLAGGTIGRSGPGVVSEGSGSTRTAGVPNGATSTIGLGALTLTSNSTIDFNLLGAGGVGTLTFASFSTTTSTLNITNWVSSASFATQTSGVDGTDDRLIFGGLVAPNTAFITFDGTPSALIPLDVGFWEVVPIPETSTWVIGALALGAIGWTQRRRLRQTLKY